MEQELEEMERAVPAPGAAQGPPAAPQGSPGTPGREAEDVPAIDRRDVAPGRGSEGQSISVPSGPSESRADAG
jgi:hypothetical protein